MESVKEENIKFNVVKKWKEKIPEMEKVYDLKKAIDKIKKTLTDNVKQNLAYKGFNVKQTTSIGDVLGKSILQMVEEMVQEIDTGGMK